MISHIILKCLIILSIVCFRGPCLWKTIGKHFPPCRSSRVGHCFPPTSALEGSLAVVPRALVLVSPPPPAPSRFPWPWLLAAWSWLPAQWRPRQIGLGSSCWSCLPAPNHGALGDSLALARVGPGLLPPVAPSKIPVALAPCVLVIVPPRWHPRGFLGLGSSRVGPGFPPTGAIEGSLAPCLGFCSRVGPGARYLVLGVLVFGWAGVIVCLWINMMLIYLLEPQSAMPVWLCHGCRVVWIHWRDQGDGAHWQWVLEPRLADGGYWVVFHSLVCYRRWVQLRGRWLGGA